MLGIVRTFLAVACVAALTISCSKDTPPPPPTVTPSDAITVTGHEQLAWDQPAASASDIGNTAFNVYIDGIGRPYNTATCDSGSSAGTFACHGPLPQMTAGRHRVELAAYYKDAPGTESPKAGPLDLNVVTATTTANQTTSSPQRAMPRSADGTAALNNAWPASAVRVFDGLAQLTDLAFTPDGRLWLSDKNGHVLVASGDTLSDSPALSLPLRRNGTGAIVALAADPQFAANRYLYTIALATGRTGTPTFTLSRFREAANTLADAIVLLDQIPASADPHASLRFGPDGKLYAAFDNAGSERLAGDLASFNGKVLRLNPDGTTPSDAPKHSPVLLTGLTSPRGLAWHARSGQLWVADQSTVGSLEWPSAPFAIASRQDTLLVGSDAGASQSTIDAQNPARLSKTTAIVNGMPIRAIATAPDGTIYFATTTTVGRLP